MSLEDFLSTGSSTKLTRNIQTYGMVAALINNDNMVTLFQRTNTRIFEAFQGVDAQINLDSCSNNPPGASIQANWAEAYREWIGTFLGNTGSSASAAASSIYSSLTGLNAPSAVLAELQSRYAPESFLLRSNDMLVLTAGATLPVKRAACTRSLSTSTSSSSSSSSSSSTPSPSTTSPPLISCSADGPEPENGINSGYCVCSGSTFAQSVITVSGTANSCGYTTLPSRTINPVTSATSSSSSAPPPPSSTTATTTYTSVTANPTGSINDCGASTFVDQTSGGSPLASDCIQIAINIENNGSWEVEAVAEDQHQLVQYGTCAFGVMGAGTTTPPDVGFNVGNSDIIDIINESVARFTNSDGLVGSKGVMQCQGEVVSSGVQDVQVTWGLYHN